MKLPLIRVVAGIAFLVLALAAASARASYFASAGEEKPAAVTISIDNFSFTPKEITVEKGTTVTWINHDDVPHTVVSGGVFRSKALDTDESFSFTFSNAGTFSYFCSVHPVMIGRVVVQ
jgi:plastocyanin